MSEARKGLAAKPQSQRSAEYRQRRDPELRGIFAPREVHAAIKEAVQRGEWREFVTVATKRKPWQ